MSIAGPPRRRFRKDSLFATGGEKDSMVRISSVGESTAVEAEVGGSIPSCDIQRVIKGDTEITL